MKTITITFYDHGSELAVASSAFPVIPGGGKINWKNKHALEERLTAPYKAPLPLTHYAESFENAFVAMAERCGLKATVETAGEWESFVE